MAFQLAQLCYGCPGFAFREACPRVCVHTCALGLYKPQREASLGFSHHTFHVLGSWFYREFG